MILKIDKKMISKILQEPQFDNSLKTRTKTSIRYAKENDREKRERRRERDVGDTERESKRERHRELPYRVCTLVENLQEISQAEK